MKRKLVWMLWVAAVLGLVLTGCGQQRTQASYIGADAAKAIALDAAGIAEGAATFASADLENRNGTDYYQVTFTADGKNYAYDIDAVTGVVISGTQNGGTGGGADASGTETAAVGEGKAKEIALNHAGLTEDQVTFVRSRLDWEDGRQVYDVEFYTSDYKEYDYEIDATTGEVLSYDYDAEATPPQRMPGPRPSLRTGPRKLPWRRSPAPRRKTSMSLRWTGTTDVWSMKGPSITTAWNMSSALTGTAAPSAAGRLTATVKAGESPYPGIEIYGRNRKNH